MKICEITGKPKARDVIELFESIENGVFMADGSHLKVAHFDCSERNLTSLVGCPQTVTGNFYCYDNDITSLKGAPLIVGGCFNCDSNKLTSFEGCPQEIGEYFSCEALKLTSLKDIHKHIKEIGGIFFAENNPISSHVLGLLKIKGCYTLRCNNKKVSTIISKYLPLGDIFDCQEELIEAGFPEFAQL